MPRDRSEYGRGEKRVVFAPKERNRESSEMAREAASVHSPLYTDSTPRALWVVFAPRYVNRDRSSSGEQPRDDVSTVKASESDWD